MRNAVVLLCVAVVSAISFAADQPQSKPARVALDRYDAAKAKLDADYHAKLLVADQQLVKELQVAVKAATKAGDLKEAQACQAIIDRIVIANAPEIQVEALIDGDSTLHITDDGVYWVQGGTVKPGKMDGRNEPTLINGAKWFPVWSSVDDHGPDRSEVFPIHTPTAANYTIASATVNDVDVRSAVSLRREEGEFLLSIPDPGPGARRYTIVLSPR